MRVLFVNVVCGVGSTGRIVTDLCAVLKAEGHQCLVAYGYGQSRAIAESDTVKTVGKAGYYAHNALAKLTDRTGLYSTAATRRLIHKIEEFDPDVIHLHNLHGYYVNYEILFAYLKRAKKPVVWTLHDCWPFTGHCAYFDAAGCEQWRTGCLRCSQLRSYPSCYLRGDVRRNFEQKKAAFTGLDKLVLVTPSRWLAGLTEASFMGDYPVQVIPNGIDLALFRPRESAFRREHGWEDKILVLAVAGDWDARKGMEDVFALSQLLDARYQTVMVGLRPEQMAQVPDRVFAIERTDSPDALAELYATADVLVNTTYEDNFPTVNLEALACGTPVITYATGGSVEAADSSCGIVVEQGNVRAMAAAMESALRLDRADARRRALCFDREARYRDYLVLYERLLQK